MSFKSTTERSPKIERRPTVWLTNLGGHPYSKAERFGTLIPLTKGETNPFKPDRIASSVGSILRQASEDDYVLVSGMPTVVGVVMAIWLTKFKKIQLLQWSMRQQDYELVTLYRETIDRASNQGEMSA